MKQDELIDNIRIILGSIRPRGMIVSVLSDSLKVNDYGKHSEKVLLKALKVMEERGFVELKERVKEPGVFWARSTKHGVLKGYELSRINERREEERVSKFGK